MYREPSGCGAGFCGVGGFTVEAFVLVEGVVIVLKGVSLVPGDGGEDDSGDVCRGLGDCSLSSCCVTEKLMDRFDGVCGTLVGVIGGGRLGGTGL